MGRSFVTNNCLMKAIKFTTNKFFRLSFSQFYQNFLKTFLKNFSVMVKWIPVTIKIVSNDWFR